MIDDRESSLLVALSKGEQTAFESIFKKYYPILCAYGTRFVDLEDAKEIAEETMIWLWEHRETHVIDTSLGKYLLRCVYHKALNHIKRNEMINIANTHFFNEIHEAIQDVNIYQFIELTKLIKEAVDKLPKSYHDVFVMHRFQQKTYKEIAEELGTSVKTVDYRMQQALKLLRNDLKDYLPFILFILAKF